MKILFKVSCLIVSFMAVYGQAYSQTRADMEMGEILNSGDLFLLKERYPQLKDSVSVEMLNLVAEAQLGIGFNRLESAATALDSLREPPQLIVCDSQVIAAVAAAVPQDVPLTTFSVLMARLKGDLPLLARGAAALHSLRPGDTVLIQEACSHHPQADDIGRVKIPRLLARLAGGELDCRLLAGRHWQDYAAAPRPRAVVHCGGCTLSRRQMTRRLVTAQRAHLPMTNYGMAISLTQGVLERVLSPFPEALAAYKETCLDQNVRESHD